MCRAASSIREQAPRGPLQHDLGALNGNHPQLKAMKRERTTCFKGEATAKKKCPAPNTASC